MWRVSVACIGAAGTILACNGGSDLPVPPQEPAAKIVIISGDAQTAAAGTQLPDSLVVRVTDSKDQPVQGQRVGFGASAGTVAPAAAATNADGRTGAIWVLGAAAGPQTVTATATGNGAPPGLAVTFHATATASTPVKLEKAAGDGQQATAGSPVATPPAVKVTDAGGNPVAGVGVGFVVTAGGGSVNPGTVSTDATGVAAVTSWTLGAAAGPNTLTATIPGTGITGNPATFTATGLVGTAGKLAIAQQPSATAPSGVPFAQQPRLQVQDAQGNPVKAGGLAVKATLASGAGAQLTGQLTVPTDANGVAAFTDLALTGPAGAYTLGFSNPTLAGVTSATIVLGPGAAAKLFIKQQPPGAAQSGVPLNPLPVVQVEDAQGNPVAQAGIAVTASLNGVGGSLGGTTTVATDGTGSAVFTSLVISGPTGAYTITFSAPQLAPATSNTIAIGAGAPAKLAFTQQPSNVAAGLAISPPVKVSIQDGSGNAVTSATNRVTVALGSNPGGSVLSGTLTVSAVSGVATFSNLSLNKPGTGYTLVATSGSLTQVTSTPFNVTVGPAAQIAANSVTSQTAPVGTAVQAPPSVIVRDAKGNPVSGVAVTFAVTQGGGTISPTSAISTSGSGTASLTRWTLGATPGPNTVTATIPGPGIVGNPVTFTATGTAPTYPARIELGTLGGNVSYANAINASGTVVGEAETGSGQVHAFRWTLAGGMVDLGMLPGDGGSIASDIDDRGTILGVSCAGSCTVGVPVYHPVTWDAAGRIHPFVRPFGVPTGYDTVDVVGLPNQQGQWAGTAFHISGMTGMGTEAVIFYSAATGIINLRTLAQASGVDTSVIGTYTYNQAVDLNERGTVLATGGREDVWRPFLWSPTAGFQLPGAPVGSDPYSTRVFGYGLNNLDEMVGSYLSEHFDGSTYTFTSGAYRWSVKEGFAILPSSSTYPPGYATAINDHGDAVGVVWPPPASAVSWPRSGGIRSLATTAGEASVALEINRDGLAIGWEGTGSGLDNHAILWNAALASSGIQIVATTGASRVAAGPTRVDPSSAFSAKVTRCLGRPSSRLARAVCIAK